MNHVTGVINEMIHPTPHPVDPRLTRGYLTKTRQVKMIGFTIMAVANFFTIAYCFVMYAGDFSSDPGSFALTTFGVPILEDLVVGYWVYFRCLWVRNPALAMKVNAAIMIFLGYHEYKTQKNMAQAREAKQQQWTAQQQNEWLAQQIAASQAQAVNQAMAQYR